ACDLRPVVKALDDREHRHDAQEQYEPPRPDVLVTLEPFGRHRRRQHVVAHIVASQVARGNVARGGVRHAAGRRIGSNQWARQTSWPPKAPKSTIDAGQISPTGLDVRTG